LGRSCESRILETGIKEDLGEGIPLFRGWSPAARVSPVCASLWARIWRPTLSAKSAERTEHPFLARWFSQQQIRTSSA